MRNFIPLLPLAVLLPGQAVAYLDPGAGSMMFQAIIAGVVAGMFILRRFWSRIAARLRPGRNRTPAAEPAPEVNVPPSTR